jgi:hypothetical protein
MSEVRKQILSLQNNKQMRSVRPEADAELARQLRLIRFELERIGVPSFALEPMVAGYDDLCHIP